MKKGKVFGKTQIAVTVMVFALAGAIWLNMKYTPSSGKYLGEDSYVNIGKNRRKGRRLFYRNQKGARKSAQGGFGQRYRNA